MNTRRVKVVQKRSVDGEKEGKEIFDDVQSSLNAEEQVIFFFFFVKYGKIFHYEVTEIQLENLILKNRVSIERVLNLNINNLEIVEMKIRDMWNRFIKDNPGTCANYFGVITIYLVKYYLKHKKRYERIEREANIVVKDTVLNKDYIDLVCSRQITYDLYECKHTVSTQRVKIIEEIKKLGDVTKKLKGVGYKSKCFFATIDFMTKENIVDQIEGILDKNSIINSEDIFGLPIS